MWIQHLWLSVLWLVYCLLHSLLAAPEVKERMSRLMKSAFVYYRFSYTVFSFLGLVGILIYQFSIISPFLFEPGIGIKLMGTIMASIGLVIMVLMIRKYFVQISGIKWLANEKVSAKLEVTGLHRLVRHPLYLGTFVFIWGFFLVWPALSLLIANIIITIYTLIGLRLEERKLVNEFGNAYLEYRKKVPMLIPKAW